MRRARKGLALLQAFAACLIVLTAPAAQASIGIIVGEPFGSFGTMMPTGHTSIFLDHICAATPTTFRPCAPGEPGVVISRYHDLRSAQLDWLATPVIPFLYGVDSPAHVPGFITPGLESGLRETYRQAHLQQAAPDVLHHAEQPTPPPFGHWAEGIGAAFDRRLFLYEIDTTPGQDAALLTWLNTLPDRRRYSLAHANCANFAADAINFLFPGAVRRNHLGDFNLMTPKQAAHALKQFGFDHPDLHLRVYEIPQLPGTLRRSRPLRGASEMFVKTKRYLAALLILQPEAIAADWIVYEKSDRWTTGQDAIELDPNDWRTLAAYSSATRTTSSAIAESSTAHATSGAGGFASSTPTNSSAESATR